MNLLDQLALYLTMPNVNANKIPTMYGAASDAGVPLDNQIMLQANPKMNDIINPERVKLRQLEDAMNGFSMTNNVDQIAVENLYRELAASGQVPLDNGTMLQANPAFAQTLAGTTPTEDMLKNVLAKHGPQSPFTQQIYQALAEQNTPLDSPTMMAANPAPQAQAQQAPKQPPRNFAEQLGVALGATVPSVSSLPNMDNVARDTIGAFLYGLLGPATLPQGTATPTPAPAPTQAPAQAKAPVVTPTAPQAKAPTQTVAPQARTASAVAPQVPAANPQDIASALLAQPVQAPTAAPAQSQSWYDNQDFMQYLSDVLVNVASNPSWTAGVAQGTIDNQNRKALAQQQAAKSQLDQATLAKTLSETERNLASARLDRTNASHVGQNKATEEAKTQAEINRIKAETALAEARTKMVGQEKAFTDQNYATAYADVLKAEQDGITVDPENPAYMFGADFSAREKLNTISPNTARYTAMSGQTKQVLDTSLKQLQAGEITKEEFASRLARAQNVHGPDAIRKYISGASNAKP